MDGPKCGGTRRGRGGASHVRRDLVDEALLQEIELLMHVIAEVAARRCPLSARQVDRLLGVELGDVIDG